MRIAELWYWFRFKKPFPQENICFSIKEAMDRIRKGNLEKGEFIVIEEAGVLMNSLEFQNRIQRFFGWVLQSFRCKNVGIIFNLPSFSMLNKTARILLHAIFLTKSVNLKTEESTLQCFYMKTDYISGEQKPIYFKHDYNGSYVKIKMMNFHLPSKELREKYEIKKNEFVDKTEDFLISEIEKEELEKDLKRLTPLQKATIRAFKNEDMEGLRKILDEKTPKEEPEEVIYVTRPVKDANGKIIGYKKVPL